MGRTAIEWRPIAETDGLYEVSSSGRVFESATIAANFLGVVKGAVSSALTGRNQTCRGFILKYETGDAS